MQINDFLGLVKKRRSIRRFKTDPVPDSQLQAVLDAARFAMSGANAQPWEFVVVKKPELRTKIADLLDECKKEANLIEMTRLPELRHPGIGNPQSYKNMKEAPVMIVVCGDPRTFQATMLSTHFTSGESATFFMNLANVTQILHLAAAAAGLGAQWVSVTRPFERSLKDLLGIPDIMRIYVIVPMGYPSYKPSPSIRRELTEMIHYDGYDLSKFRSDEKILDFLRELRRKTHTAYNAKMIKTKRTS